VQRVVDDVLGEVETDVVDVLARDPADLRAVLALDLLLADGMGGQAMPTMTMSASPTVGKGLQTRAGKTRYCG